MTAAIKEAYAYADADVTIYETFQLTQATWATPIKLVNSSRELVTADGTFKPATIEATLPETEASVRGQLQITIDFLPAEYRAMLWSVAKETAPVYLYYREYTGEGVAEEAEAELPVALVVNNIELTDTQTIITALYPDLVNIPFGRRIMTATNLPGART